MVLNDQDDDEIVALEACEFWSAYCETKQADRDTLQQYLKPLVPILLKAMIYRCVLAHHSLVANSLVLVPLTSCNSNLVTIASQLRAIVQSDSDYELITLDQSDNEHEADRASDIAPRHHHSSRAIGHTGGDDDDEEE